MWAIRAGYWLHACRRTAAAGTSGVGARPRAAQLQTLPVLCCSRVPPAPGTPVALTSGRCLHALAGQMASLLHLAATQRPALVLGRPIALHAPARDCGPVGDSVQPVTETPTDNEPAAFAMCTSSASCAARDRWLHGFAFAYIDLSHLASGVHQRLHSRSSQYTRARRSAVNTATWTHISLPISTDLGAVWADVSRLKC